MAVEEEKLALVLDLDLTLVHTAALDGFAGSRDGLFDPVALAWLQESAAAQQPQQQHSSGELIPVAGDEVVQPAWIGDEFRALLLRMLRPEDLQDVFVIGLEDENMREIGGNGGTRTQLVPYVVKLRPGVRAFLRRVSAQYELFVYTHGTLEYAHQIISLLDPVGDILHPSRMAGRSSAATLLSGGDGSPPGLNMTRKDLSVLFPDARDWARAVILDDRSDIWTSDAGIPSPNLLRVAPFHYFKVHEELNAQPSGDEHVPSQTASPVQDRDLGTVELLLQKVHALYIGQHVATGLISAQPHPDSRDIVRFLHQRVFHGCAIVFSHVIPRTTEAGPVLPESTQIWKMVEFFGGLCFSNFESAAAAGKRVTHLVASRAETEKVSAARFMESVFIVSRAWLDESVRRWERLDEFQFPVQDSALNELVPVLREGSSPPAVASLDWGSFRTHALVQTLVQSLNAQPTAPPFVSGGDVFIGKRQREEALPFESAPRHNDHDAAGVMNDPNFRSSLQDRHSPLERPLKRARSDSGSELAASQASSCQTESDSYQSGSDAGRQYRIPAADYQAFLLWRERQTSQSSTLATDAQLQEASGELTDGDAPVGMPALASDATGGEEQRGRTKDRETDEHRLAQRQRQIDIGKNSDEYKLYNETFPSGGRRKRRAKTPDKYQVCSKRSFDGQISKWRRQLHTEGAGPVHASKAPADCLNEISVENEQPAVRIDIANDYHSSGNSESPRGNITDVNINVCSRCGENLPAGISYTTHLKAYCSKSASAKHMRLWDEFFLPPIEKFFIELGEKTDLSKKIDLPKGDTDGLSRSKVLAIFTDSFWEKNGRVITTDQGQPSLTEVLARHPTKYTLFESKKKRPMVRRIHVIEARLEEEARLLFEGHLENYGQESSSISSLRDLAEEKGLRDYLEKAGGLRAFFDRHRTQFFQPADSLSISLVMPQSNTTTEMAADATHLGHVNGPAFDGAVGQPATVEIADHVDVSVNSDVLRLSNNSGTQQAAASEQFAAALGDIIPVSDDEVAQFFEHNVFAPLLQHSPGSGESATVLLSSLGTAIKTSRALTAYVKRTGGLGEFFKRNSSRYAVSRDGKQALEVRLLARLGSHAESSSSSSTGAASDATDVSGQNTLPEAVAAAVGTPSVLTAEQAGQSPPAKKKKKCRRGRRQLSRGARKARQRRLRKMGQADAGAKAGASGDTADVNPLPAESGAPAFGERVGVRPVDSGGKIVAAPERDFADNPAFCLQQESEGADTRALLNTASDISTGARGDKTTAIAGDPTTLAAGDPTTLAAGDPTTLTAGDPTALTAGDPTTLPAGDPTTLPAGDPTTSTAGDLTTLTVGSKSFATELLAKHEVKYAMCPVDGCTFAADSVSLHVHKMREHGSTEEIAYVALRKERFPTRKQREAAAAATGDPMTVSKSDTSSAMAGDSPTFVSGGTTATTATAGISLPLSTSLEARATPIAMNGSVASSTDIASTLFGSSEVAERVVVPRPEEGGGAQDHTVCALLQEQLARAGGSMALRPLIKLVRNECPESDWLCVEKMGGAKMFIARHPSRFTFRGTGLRKNPVVYLCEKP